jgi:hypothetical protein
MKIRITNYSFSASTKQITFLDYPAIGITLDSVLLITHAPSNTIIYNFADSALGGTVSGNVLTLSYNTTLFSNTDKLLIYYDDAEKDISIHEDVFGSKHLDDGNGNIRTSVQKYLESPIAFKTLSGLGREVAIDCTGYATVVAEMSGLIVGTIMFEALLMSGNWISINGVNASSTTMLSPFVFTTAANAYPLRFSVSGFTRLRIRFSSYTSGLLQVTLKATTAPIVNYCTTLSGTSATQDTDTPQLYGATNAAPTALNGAALVRPWQEPLPLPQPSPVLPTTYPNNYLSKLPQYYSRLRVEAGGDQKLPLAQEQNTNILKVTDDDNFQLLEAILFELKTQTLIMAEAFNVSPQKDLTNI